MQHEESPFKGKTGLRRLWNAFHYTLDGFAAAYKCEDAFRQELRLAALLIPLTFFLPASGIGKALMIASVLLVLIVELLNSAIEAVVDRVYSNAIRFPSAPRMSAAPPSSSRWRMSWPSGAACCSARRR